MNETTPIVPTGPVSIALGDRPYSAPYTSAGLEQCENLYIEKAITETSSVPYYYVSIPGMRAWINSSGNSSASCRGLYTTGTNKLYGVWGNKLYEVRLDGTKEDVGTLNTSSGTVSFADNGIEMCIVDGRSGYIVVMTSNAFSYITDSYFPGIADNDPSKSPTRVFCIDSYFLVNKQNSSEYYWSTPGYTDVAFDSDQPTETNNWNGLQFGVKIGDSDNIVTMAKCVNLLWLFGKQSIEVHVNTGDYNGQLFARSSNALINFGCTAKDSVVTFGNNIFWMGADKNGTVGIFTASTDFMPTRISTRGVESYIQSMSKFDDAIAFTYAADGHAFICWYFPAGNQTWCYDIVTSAWHRRTHYDYTSGVVSAHRALYATFAFGKNLVGDRLTNAVYEYDQDYFVNDNADGVDVNYIQRIKTSPVHMNSGKLTRYKTFQLIMQQGSGTTLNDDNLVGQDPRAMISWSNDYGNSWSNERDVSIGKQGEYGKRTRLTNLGSGRYRTWKIRVTDPVRIIIAALLIESEEFAR
jgi:hypothetical protein